MRAWCIMATGGIVWKDTLTGSSLLVPFAHVPAVGTHFLTLSVYNISTGIFVEKSIERVVPDKDQVIVDEHRKIRANAKS